MTPLPKEVDDSVEQLPNPDEEVLVQTDARHMQETGRCSIGVAIFQPEDELVGTYRARVDETDSFYCEFTAFIRAIDLLVFLGASDVVLQTDSEGVALLVDKDEERSPRKDRCVSYTLRARDQLGNFDSVQIDNIPRGDNTVAHILAKSALEDTPQMDVLEFEQEFVVGPLAGRDIQVKP